MTKVLKHPYLAGAESMRANWVADFKRFKQQQQIKKKKEDDETMREMEKYQEDRRIERERKYGLKPQKWAKFLGAGQEAAY